MCEDRCVPDSGYGWSGGCCGFLTMPSGLYKATTHCPPGFICAGCANDFDFGTSICCEIGQEVACPAGSWGSTCSPLHSHPGVPLSGYPKATCTP